MKYRIFAWVSLLMISFSAFGNQWISICTPEHINEIEEIDGQFYMATNGGLVVYDPVAQTRQHFLVEDGLPSTKVEDIMLGPDGNIWIGTYDNGIAVLENGEWSKIPDALVAPPNQLLTYCLSFDENGVLWAGTSNGIQKYENGTWSSEYPMPAWEMVKMDDGSILAGSFLPIQIRNGIATEDTSCPIFAYSDATVEVGPNGNQIFGAPGFGVAHKMDTGWHVFDHTNSALPLNANGISDIELAPDGSLWAMMPSKGVYSYTGSTWQQDITSLDLPGLTWSTTQLLPASDGSLFIGTQSSLTSYTGASFDTIDLTYMGLTSNNSEIAINQSGVAVIKNGKSWFEFAAPDENSGPLPLPGGLTDIHLMEMLELPDGKLGLLDLYSGDLWVDGIATSIYIPQALPFPSPSYFRSIHVDQNDQYWFAGIGGLYMTDGTNSRFFTDSNSIFTDPNFWQVASDREGNVWASTADGIGKWNGQQWTYFDAADYNLMFGAASYELYFDDDNELWFAGWGTGLVHYDGNQWEHFTTGNSNIAANIIFDIEEHDGKMYLATTEGLSIFDGSSFTNSTRQNSGILSNDTRQVKFDSNGNMWLTHPGVGISVFNSNGFNTGFESYDIQPMGFQAYPNPSAGDLQIVLTQDLLGRQLQVFSLNGRLIRELTVTDTSIQIRELTCGIYLVKVENHIQRLVVR